MKKQVVAQIKLLLLVLLMLAISACGGKKESPKETPKESSTAQGNKTKPADEVSKNVVSAPSNFFAIKETGKYGFIDATGKVVASAMLEEVGTLSEGLARFRMFGKYGYMNDAGKDVINRQFDGASEFKEGLARVKLGYKTGFVNKDGKYDINPQFEAARDFSEGLAAVREKGKWGFIDKTGKFVIEPKFEATGGFFTLVIQASSATVAIAISLASQDMISLSVRIALMMGAEIGTCSDTLLATIGRSREAVRTGVFHLLFNIFSVVLGLFFIKPFTELIIFISAGASTARQIANAHFLFNMLGVLIFASFTPWVARALYQNRVKKSKFYNEVMASEATQSIFACIFKGLWIATPLRGSQ